MTVRIGANGAGMIGADHIDRLSTTVTHATVTGVFDLDEARVASIAKTGGCDLPRIDRVPHRCRCR